ncbi:MAG TPA: amidohydrolase [Phaeodactylibacter sp.]|nr:amidohydrolase [Phaeodactylibacter sp.]
MMKFFIPFLLVIPLFFFACTEMSEKAMFPDLILYNGVFATMDSAYTDVEALAVRDGHILELGTKEEILALAGDSTELIDLQGAFAMPAFVEGHGHFHSLGKSLVNLNFLHAQSWEEIVQQVAEAARKAAPGAWIQGRGWHQEKWAEMPRELVDGYPVHHSLSEVSPENPVILFHASGHALFANEAAMKAAGITAETAAPAGGAIIRDAAGQPTGVFEENAMQPVADAWERYEESLPEEEREARYLQALHLAQAECFDKGIATFTDAACSAEEALRYRHLSESGELKIRLYTMLFGTPTEVEEALHLPAAEDGQPPLPVFPQGDGMFSCRGIKVFFDGALGSHGAWLLEPYADKPGFTGQNTTPPDSLRKFAEIALQNGLQLCVHAIGDRANREVLDLYGQMFAERRKSGSALRWRIEHAQHLSADDIPRFGALGVIPAMQAIHCTSDAPFVVERLGEERARTGAYAWRALLDSGARIANGTDAPVEEVDPIPNFYAAVSRKRADGGEAFFPEQRMSREEALRSYTIDAAYAAFLDAFTGSLSPGKSADIVVLSNNLLNCPEDNILKTEVLKLFVRGEQVK